MDLFNSAEHKGPVSSVDIMNWIFVNLVLRGESQQMIGSRWKVYFLHISPRKRKRTIAPNIVSVLVSLAVLSPALTHGLGESGAHLSVDQQ